MRDELDSGAGPYAVLPPAALAAARAARLACATLGEEASTEAGWSAGAAELAVDDPAALASLAADLRAAGAAPLGVGLRLAGEPVLTGAPAARRASVAVHALVSLGEARSAWAMKCTADGGSCWPMATASAPDGGGLDGAPPGVRVLLDGTPAYAPPGGVAPVPGGELQLHWTGDTDPAGPLTLLARRFAAAMASPEPVPIPAPAGEAEARLARVGFDLHDGPLQDLALVRTWVSRAHEAIAKPDDDLRAREAFDRLADVTAVLEVLDDELRELACSLDAGAALRRPLHLALHGAVRTFSLRGDVEPVVDIGRGLDELPDAHRVAVLRIVEAALGNVRLHSGATKVLICVRRTADGVEATIADDGAGFRVEDAMLQAGRAGRLGLLGMMERARVLGGQCTVRSAPGAGTEVALSLPDYRAASAGSASAAG